MSYKLPNNPKGKEMKSLKCMELMENYSVGRPKSKLNSSAAKLRKISCKTFHRKT